MNEIFDVLIGIVVVAGILVMTKPGSQGPTLVSDLTSGFSSALGVATGAA